MLRERLKEMDFRITELADYLQISRPTMYKFIDYFDNSEYNLINKKVLKLFNYISENDLAGKNNVIRYILNNFVDLKELDDKKELEYVKKFKKFIITNPDCKKSQFLKIAVCTTKYDEFFYFLVDVNEYITKKKLSPKQEIKINLYNQIIKQLRTITKEEK